MPQQLTITWIDSRSGDVDAKMAELRRKLSPRGDVVSPAGRQRTLEIFGEALTPQQIVEKICRDIDAQGLPALLDYNKRIDGATITTETLRVGEAELIAAHKQADALFLQTLRNIPRTSANFKRPFCTRMSASNDRAAT